MLICQIIEYEVYKLHNQIKSKIYSDNYLFVNHNKKNKIYIYIYIIYNSMMKLFFELL